MDSNRAAVWANVGLPQWERWPQSPRSLHRPISRATTRPPPKRVVSRDLVKLLPSCLWQAGGFSLGLSFPLWEEAALPRIQLDRILWFPILAHHVRVSPRALTTSGLRRQLQGEGQSPRGQGLQGWPDGNCFWALGAKLSIRGERVQAGLRPEGWLGSSVAPAASPLCPSEGSPSQDCSYQAQAGRGS